MADWLERTRAGTRYHVRDEGTHKARVRHYLGHHEWCVWEMDDKATEVARGGSPSEELAKARADNALAFELGRDDG